MKGILNRPGLRWLLPSFMRPTRPTPDATADQAPATQVLDPGASITLTVTAAPRPAIQPAPDPMLAVTGHHPGLPQPVIIGVGLVLSVLGTAGLIYWLAATEQQGASQEARDIAIFGMSLLLGFLVALFARITVRIQSDAVLLFLTIAPLFLMLVATQRINLLKAPGGLELSFAERAVQIRNDPANQAVVLEVAEAAPISPGLPPESVSRLTMSIQFGRGDYQRKWLIDNLAPGQSQYVNLRYIVFVDADNRFIAFMPLASFINLLELDIQGAQMERVINQGRRLELLRFPGVIPNALVATGPATDDLPTNGDVLRTMLQHNLPAVAVIGPDGRLIGLVERDQIVSDLLLDLTSEDGSP